MKYIYRDFRGFDRAAELKVIKAGAHAEFEVTDTGGNLFHVICGRHEYGNYLCIPNWSVGSELAGLHDYFWNNERMIRYAKLEEHHADLIANALVRIDRNYHQDWMRGF